MMDNKKTIEELKEYIHELELEIKKTKKYGLVWDKERIKENVVLQCENNIPLLSSHKEKDIICGGGNNLLIEGDNYHSLIALNYLEKESTDVIYIDPPYNTGNKDFIYNDKFVDCEDGYRHSKWLNFMYKRLALCRLLLRYNGIILISIDVNELCNLKLLCDEVFGEQNLISIMPRKTVEHIRTTSTYELQNLNDYVLFYAKNKLNTILNKKIVGSKEYNFEDEIGFYMLKPFQNSGENGTREARPNLYYPIYFNQKTKKLSLVKNSEDDIEILPRKVRNKDGRWLWSREKFLKDNELLEYKDNKLYRKEYYNPESDQNRYAAYKNWLDMFPNRLGANALKKLNLLEKFDYSKPVELMKMLINIHPNKNCVVLDFFAGSGTTGQAVLELNKEDGGNRKFILCTNNENNICTNVTYPRLKAVITGIRQDGSKYSDGIQANLRCFKTAFLKDNSNRDQAKYELVEKVDSLLCIHEDIYDEMERNDYSSHYHNGNKHMFIYNEYFDTEKFNEFKNRVINTKGQKIVYIFSNNNYLNEDYFNGNSEIELKPIPAKIYEVYKEIVEDIKRG